MVMQPSYFLAFLSLVATSWAITVTSPGKDTAWPSSGPNTVTWTSVSTDPDSVAVTLVQQGVFKQTLADKVSTAQGSLTITSTLPVGDTYQVNLVKSSAPQDLNTILAQSEQFNVTQGGATSRSGGSTSTSIATSTGGLNTPTSTSAGGGNTLSGTSAGTDLPNASNTALNPTGSPSSAASSSLQIRDQSGLLGILALLGFALI